MTKAKAHTFTLGGERVTLTPGQLVRAARKIEPEPVRLHGVVIEGRLFPPKQVVSAATGVDRLNFPTHEAIRVLRTLGFTPERQT